jgi:multimeric flavodoxin WrbA
MCGTQQLLCADCAAQLRNVSANTVSDILALFQTVDSCLAGNAGSLAGMPVTFFTSTGTQGAGQEETILTSLTQAVHHGMIYVPPGYTHGGPMYMMDEPRGGSPWGAGTLAGADNSRPPSAAELAYAGALCY